MKAICCTIICLTALTLTSALAQPSPGAEPQRSTRRGFGGPGGFGSASSPDVGEVIDDSALTKFNLDFPGGTPEELVLNGAFQHAFQSEGVTFHSGSGTFEMPRANIGRLCVEGDGDAAFWTRRAFERCGYSLVDAAASPIQIYVVEDGPRRRWQIRHGGQHYEASSLPEATSTVSRWMGTSA